MASTMNGMIAPLPLPTLIEVACPECQGEGGWDDEHGTLMCFTCCGTGRVEACPVCNEVPTIIAGNDACGCTFAGAFKHPEILWAIDAGMITAEQVGM
jgi:DnaJ-class molecular chaperone